jgi:hypothetical protein
VRARGVRPLVAHHAGGAVAGAGKAAVLLGGRAEELAQLESRQAGKPIRLAREFDVPGTVDNVAFFAGAARSLEGRATAEYSPDHTSSIRREPVGVVGSIAPWNYPLQMAGWKVLPALAAGNTVVLKPSELTPLTTLVLAEVLAEAGLPDGALNVVTGTGEEAGAHLVAHPGVDLVSFTGSTAVGSRCSWPPRPPSSGCTWSSAARRRSWCSTTPTPRPRRGVRWPARSSTPVRTAPRPPAPTCSARSTTPSSSGSRS